MPALLADAPPIPSLIQGSPTTMKSKKPLKQLALSIPDQETLVSNFLTTSGMFQDSDLLLNQNGSRVISEESNSQGSGVKVSIRQLGPGMIQQMQHRCNECKGTGETISYKDRCPQCDGEKVVQEKKVLEMHVEKGMQNDQKITFPGEADEAPDCITGDIVFVLQQKEHPKFKWKGDDLFVEHTLSLTEALFGFQYVSTHLDGRQLLIKTNPRKVLVCGKR